ncbi:MAG: hypothetical protein Q8L27_00745 [archaeon]|nr:hypothetical protein [archaeon]
MKNKKSSIGTTLTWIVATFIIIFILILYFVFLGIIYEKNNPENKEIGISYSGVKISAVTFLIDFLKSDSGNGESIYDLLKKAGNNDGKDSEREGLFEEKAENFLKSSFPLDSYAGAFLYFYEEKDGNWIFSQKYLYSQESGKEAGTPPENRQNIAKVEIVIPLGKKIILIVQP